MQAQHTRNDNPSLTDTTSTSSVPVTRPNNNIVTFTFSTDPARPHLTQLTLPRGSTWTPGPHWHESYTEYLLVKQGRVKVVLDGKSRIVTARDGPQVVEKGVVHEWMRADNGADEAELDDEEVVVEEWTDPADGIKHVFFRNLLGVMTDAERYWKSWVFIQIVLIFDGYDNYIVVVPESWPKWVSYYATHALFAANRAIATVLRLKPWYGQYTPVELRQAAASPLPSRKLKGH